MATFPNVELRIFEESSFSCRTIGTVLTLCINFPKLVLFRQSDVIKEINIGSETTITRLSSKTALVSVQKDKHERHPASYLIAFESPKDTVNFMKTVQSKDQLIDLNHCEKRSIFDKRTESWSAVQYFQFYSYLSQQQNMMQDYIRTSTYQRAILANSTVDFRGKVVLDVGAGSGILSFFAIQAGATRVYAVEASNVAKHCNILVQSNKLAGRIVVINGKIEEISLPEPVDVIISEPMGYMLYNERMLETYVHARKFLAPHLRQSGTRHHSQPKPSEDQVMQDGDPDDNEDNPTAEDGDHHCLSSGGDEESASEMPNDSDAQVKKSRSARGNRAVIAPGVMFPTVANLYIAPFSDEALFAEQYAKANFWYQQSFHGMDLTALRNAAVTEYFNQPIVDTFDIGLCLAPPCAHKVDFRTVSEEELTSIDIPLHYQINTSSTVHGLAFWFDVGFLGSQRDVWLSTSPTEPLTHWYQVRCLLGTPLFVQEGQALSGRVMMQANPRQSYDVQIELTVPGSLTKITNTLDLKNPHFRYTGYPPAPPPGSNTRCPTETFYTNLYQQQQQQQQHQQDQQSQHQIHSTATGGILPNAFPQPAVPGSAYLPEDLQASQLSAAPVGVAAHVHAMQISPQLMLANAAGAPPPGGMPLLVDSAHPAAMSNLCNPAAAAQTALFPPGTACAPMTNESALVATAAALINSRSPCVTSNGWGGTFTME